MEPINPLKNHKNHKVQDKYKLKQFNYYYNKDYNIWGSNFTKNRNLSLGLKNTEDKNVNFVLLTTNMSTFS